MICGPLFALLARFFWCAVRRRGSGQSSWATQACLSITLRSLRIVTQQNVSHALPVAACAGILRLVHPPPSMLPKEGFRRPQGMSLRAHPVLNGSLAERDAASWLHSTTSAKNIQFGLKRRAMAAGQWECNLQWRQRMSVVGEGKIDLPARVRYWRAQRGETRPLTISTTNGVALSIHS